jgi:hypothetical protein
MEVTTSTVRGAGTSGQAELTFIGDAGVSHPIPLEYEKGTSPVGRCKLPLSRSVLKAPMISALETIIS